MPDQPTQYQQVYGFVPKKRHFIWRNPEDVKLPTRSDSDGKQASPAEVLDAVTEVAASCPSIAREMLSILTEPEAQAQQPQLPNDAASIVVLSETKPSRRADPTSEDTKAPATIDVTPCTEAVASGDAECATQEASGAGSSQVAPSHPPKKSHGKKKKPPPKPLSRLEAHQAHCSICGYEDQEEIDEAFVNWDNIYKIADEYEIDRRTIYRHAHATGLFAKRANNLRGALGHLIHEADRVSPTADSIVRAVRTFAHINARGEWVNPPTRVVFSTDKRRPANARTPILSVTPCKVEKDLNR